MEYTVNLTYKDALTMVSIISSTREGGPDSMKHRKAVMEAVKKSFPKMFEEDSEKKRREKVKDLHPAENDARIAELIDLEVRELLKEKGSVTLTGYQVNSLIHMIYYEMSKKDGTGEEKKSISGAAYAQLEDIARAWKIFSQVDKKISATKTEEFCGTLDGDELKLDGEEQDAGKKALEEGTEPPRQKVVKPKG